MFRLCVKGDHQKKQAESYYEYLLMGWWPSNLLNDLFDCGPIAEETDLLL